MRRGTTTRGRVMLAAAWGVVVLAGCTATAEPEVEPTSEAVVQSTEPTPTSTPTPTPTVPPESIKPERPEYEVSDAGAEAFAEYFLMLYPYVYATGDLSEWTAISGPECVLCQSVISNVTEQTAAGNQASGGLVTITSIAGRKIAEDYFAVDVTIEQSPSEERGPHGTLISSSDASSPTLHIALLPSEAGWTVSGVQVNEGPE